MKWRNSKERELLSTGGSRDSTLPNKNNPNPDLSDVTGNSDVEEHSEPDLVHHDEIPDNSVETARIEQYPHMSAHSQDIYRHLEESEDVDDDSAGDSCDEEIDVS